MFNDKRLFDDNLFLSWLTRSWLFAHSIGRRVGFSDEALLETEGPFHVDNPLASPQLFLSDVTTDD